MQLQQRPGTTTSAVQNIDTDNYRNIAATATSAEKTEFFVRNRLVWTYYLMIGSVGFLLSALGPLMPFLRSELSLDYRTCTFHFGAYALGNVMAGFLGDRLIKTLGRSKTIWGAVVGTGLGITIFTLSRQAPFTIYGAWQIGLSASLVYITVSTVIADYLGESRATAVAEAEMIAMLAASTAPFAISNSVRCGLGWRSVLITLIPILLMLSMSLRTFRIAAPSNDTLSTARGKLPLSFWSYAAVIFLSCAAEWCLGFWSADFFEHISLLNKQDAAAAVSCFFIAMSIGRFSGSRAVGRYGIAKVLLISAVLSLVGIFVFWLGNCAPLHIAGSFICGLGIANMYPMSFCGAVATVTNSSVAISRLTVAAGSAILAAPLTLGLIADRAGIFVAFGAVAVLLVACASVILWANYLSRNDSPISSALH